MHEWELEKASGGEKDSDKEAALRAAIAWAEESHRELCSQLEEQLSYEVVSTKSWCQFSSNPNIGCTAPHDKIQWAILEAFLTTPESRSPVFLDGSYNSHDSSTQTGWSTDLDTGSEMAWHNKEHSAMSGIWRIASQELPDHWFSVWIREAMKMSRYFCWDVTVMVLLPLQMCLLPGIYWAVFMEIKLYYADNARASMSFDICETDLVTGQKRVILEKQRSLQLARRIEDIPNGQWLLYNKLLGKSNNAWMVNTVSGEARRIAPDSEISSETCPVLAAWQLMLFLLTNREGEFKFSVAHMWPWIMWIYFSA